MQRHPRKKFTVSDLVQAIGCDRKPIYRLLKELKIEGYVKHEILVSDANHWKTFYYWITAAGKRLKVPDIPNDVARNRCNLCGSKITLENVGGITPGNRTVCITCQKSKQVS